MDQLYIVQQYAICSTLIRKESHTYFDIVVTVFKVLNASVKRKTSVLV
jgi:hypothetical protein